MRDERFDQPPVRKDHNPAADLERDRKRLAQPRLGFLGPIVGEREDSEPPDDVLNLEVGVTGTLEPRSGLQAEALGLLGPTARIGDDSEPRRRLRFHSVTAQLGGQLEAAA